MSAQPWLEGVLQKENSWRHTKLWWSYILRMLLSQLPHMFSFHPRKLSAANARLVRLRELTNQLSDLGELPSSSDNIPVESGMLVVEGRDRIYIGQGYIQAPGDHSHSDTLTIYVQRIRSHGGTQAR